MKHLVIGVQIRTNHSFMVVGADRHYLVDVLRKTPGDEIEVLDATGRRFLAVISGTGREAVELVARSEMTAPEEALQVTLYQAVPKGRRIEDIIRASVQAGVTCFVPIVTERTIVRFDHDKSRYQRWERIAREAVQQSGADRIPRIEEVAPLRDLRPTSEVSLFLHTDPLADGTLHGYLDRGPNSVALVVGPEGGFSDDEVHLLQTLGFRPLYLGPRTLRTESAALFALGAVQILIQEHQSWRSTSTLT